MNQNFEKVLINKIKSQKWEFFIFILKYLILLFI